MKVKLHLLQALSLIPTRAFAFASTFPAPSYRTSIVRRAMTTDEQDGAPPGPVWDPVAQIYVGGVVPENAEVTKMIESNKGTLRLFGYGSLCWKPSGILANEKVDHTLGRARGYRRCWAQKSTDHRGNPSFPGIVCTLLKDDEVRQYRGIGDEESLTEGLLYEVPPDLVDECLAELDFREKGGYARDIINVIEDETGETVQALLYRGTPDNPAFWPRALRDLPFAAAVMSTAIGPSGKNSEYLQYLDEFLEARSEASILEKFDDTFSLARMASVIKDRYSCHFLFGCGSNQHNQLLLTSRDNVADLHNGEDAHIITESLLLVPKVDNDPVVRLIAGGGHSGCLARSGRLYLFGWNDDAQCGSSETFHEASKLFVVSELCIRVEKCSLGFSHTLVLEKGTGRLLAFGNNKKGQCGLPIDVVREPCVPPFLINESVVEVSAGLFHSAVVTEDGDLITFGAYRIGLEDSKDGITFARWSPNDAKVVHVACGRKHTMILDSKKRVWTVGDNKYGQLGRRTDNVSSIPGVVEGPWQSRNYESLEVYCGWSHSVVACRKGDVYEIFGTGRNDKGQLGIVHGENTDGFVHMFAHQQVTQVACGSEATAVVDGEERIVCCGWNEHGNLGTGIVGDAVYPTQVQGAPITITPGYGDKTRVGISLGGGHLIAMRVPM